MQASMNAAEVLAPSDAAVLEQYVSFYQNEDAGSIRDHLFSNSVVDWFGRSVRGAHKIVEFCKYEVAQQYDHTNSFQKPEECEPIEQRPVHVSTKRIPTRDVDYINPRNKVNAISLKPYADSDSDDVDDAVAHEELMPLLLPGNKTPERAEGEMMLAPLTPPTSKTKPHFDASSTESDDDNEDDFMEVRAKRMKRSHPTAVQTTAAAAAIATTTSATSNNYLRRLAPAAAAATATTHKGAAHKQFGGRDDLQANDTSGEEGDEDIGVYNETLDAAANAATAATATTATATTSSTSTKPEYTNLRYFEVMGVLRKRTHADDYNDAKKETAAACSADDEDDDDATSTGCWDRPIRIRISYRTRVSDQHVYFALIIYDHVDGKLQQQMCKPLRRNLLTEFTQKTAPELPSSDTETETVEVERLNAAAELAATNHTETLLPAAMDIIASSDTSHNAISDPLRTPTKLAQTPPATPKRKPRPHFAAVSGMKRLHVSTSTPKRSAARSLRL